MTKSLKCIGPKVKRADTRIVRPMPKKADPFYLSPEWRRLRQMRLDIDHGRCVACGAPAVVVDHIVSRKSGGLDRIDNLRSLCRICDNRFKEDHEGRRRGQRAGGRAAPGVGGQT